MNSVSIIGYLREVIDERFRYFEYELPYEEVEDENDIYNQKMDKNIKEEVAIR